MKKALKIIIISIGTVLVLLLLTVGILSWVVFTPEKLTPMVRSQVAKFITCKSEIGSVELTFFSSFPEFGLKIDELKLIRPMPNAPSDTLLIADNAFATIDIQALWKNEELIIHEFSLNDVTVNAFVGTDGKANFDIMQPDTTEQDTSAFHNPFKNIQLDRIGLRNGQLSYVDLSTKTYAEIHNLNAQVKLSMKGNAISAHLKMASTAVSVKMDTVEYLQAAAINMNVPIEMQLAEQKFALKNAELTTNGIKIKLNGAVQNNAQNGDIGTDLRFYLEKCQIKTLLAMIPKQFTSTLEGIDLDGMMLATGNVRGIYNDRTFPIIDLNLELENGNFAYADFPYRLREMSGNMDVKLNLNEDLRSYIRINRMVGISGKSLLDVSGLVDQLMSDIRCDLNMKLQLNLAEAKPLLPADMPLSLKGTAIGTARAKFTLSQIDKLDFEKMIFNGKFRLSDLTAIYDTLSLQTNEAFVDFKLPNSHQKKTSFVQMLVTSAQLNLKQGLNTQATLGSVSFDVATSDVIKTDQSVLVDCNFKAATASGNMDNMQALLTNSKGKFLLQMDLVDSTAIPVFDCDFDIEKFVANMDTISVDIDSPKGNFTYKPEKGNSKSPVMKLVYQSEQLAAKMGEQRIDTRKVNVDAKIMQDKNQENVLLQWIPKGFVTMEHGKINSPSLTSEIQIPNIQFDFTPDEYLIKNSRVIIDRSDFQLQGKLSNVRQYLKNEGLLKGDFDFNSNVTDLNYLMNLTNGIGYDETAETVKEPTSTVSSGGPFMVPKGVDLTLRTTINQALYATDTARNVRGNLTIKDGSMVLESMLFTASAAKMQLTALYQTPRRNHLFVGMDFHLLDIEISELLAMIPDIDSIMPMLRSFGGKGEFHIAVETNLDSLYNLKKSTLRGVSSLKGQNLVLMDGETFSEIAKTLRFNKKTENKVDSLSAEFTIFKQEVDIYPFLIVMDKYKAVVAGRHNLDMNFDYHISVTDSPLPFRLGVNVSGNLDNMKYRPAKCKYANLYRPAARNEIDTKQLEIRKMIREALTKNVTR